MRISGREQHKQFKIICTWHLLLLLFSCPVMMYSLQPHRLLLQRKYLCICVYTGVYKYAYTQYKYVYMDTGIYPYIHIHTYIYKHKLIGFAIILIIPKFEKLSSGHRTGKGQFSFQSQRKAMPKNAQTTAQLHSSHTLVK